MRVEVLNVNSKAVEEHTLRLERMTKAAFPVVVRQTLNSAAYDVKRVTMPLESDIFVHRSPTFFKARSKVVPATGFNVNTMYSMVGFMPESGNPKEKGGATEDLEEQEHSGDIEHRAFVPLAKARAGGNWNRNVRADMRMQHINSRMSVKTKSSIVDALKSNGKNDKENFTRAAILAGKGGFVLGTGRNSKGNRLLYRINSVYRLKAGSKNGTKGNTVINSTAIYAVKAGRKVHPRATHFMEKASLLSATKIERTYIVNANKKLATLR